MDRWYFPLDHVEQGDSNGCVVASVAIVTGLSYLRARHEMFPKRRDFVDDRSLWCDEAQSTRCLRRLGFATRQVDDHRRTKRPALVSFAWHPEDPRSCAHCVVWDPWKERFIDPGNANGYVSHEEAERFIDLWKRTAWTSTLVTGRLR